MANQQQKSKKLTTRSGDPRALAAKKNRVVDAAQAQKKKAAVRTVRGVEPNAAVRNDADMHSSGPPRPPRRSSRLNGIPTMTKSPVQSKRTKDANATMASRQVRPHSYTPLDEGAQSDAQGSLEEVQDLQQQLQEERRQSSHTHQ